MDLFVQEVFVSMNIPFIETKSVTSHWEKLMAAKRVVDSFRSLDGE